MKAIKTILATLLCLSLVLSFAVMGTFAAGTASITVKDQSDSNATVGGKTLRLFQIFQVETDGTNTAYEWIVKDGVNLYESFFYGDTVTDADGISHTFPDRINSEKAPSINDVVAYIDSIGDSAYDLSQMATDLHEYIHAKGLDAFEGYVKTANVPEGATSYTFSDLSLGYYMIYDATEFTEGVPAVRSAAMLAHSGESVVIELKADRPTVNKYVDDDKTDGVIDDLGATASIGETVDFRIVTKIPDHQMYGEQYTFILSDVMADGLELDKDSLAVTLTSADGSSIEVTDQNVQVETEGLDAGVDFKVTLLDATNIEAGTVVEVTYQATVLATAVKVNENAVTLTYSNDPNSPTLTGSVTSDVSVMLWDGVITKLKEGSNQRLGGAEFQIFKKVDGVVSSTPLTFTYDADTEKYTYNPGGDTTALKTVNDTESANFGQILLFGLGEGTYVLRETEAPTGYIQADGDFEFTLVDAINTDGSISAMNTSIAISRDADIAGQFVDVRVRPYEDNGTLAMVYHLGITNRPGSELPETGGMGTALFTVFGVVLMVGALAFFTSRKRSSAV